MSTLIVATSYCEAAGTSSLFALAGAAEMAGASAHVASRDKVKRKSKAPAPIRSVSYEHQRCEPRRRRTGRDRRVDVDLRFGESVEAVDGQRRMSEVVQNAEKQDLIELLAE